jgi:hypothetical protein
VESQKQASPSSHRSLEISHTTRDSHIPTAAARRAGKVENQKQVSRFPIPPRNDELGFLSPERSGLRPPRQPLRGEPNTIAESRQQVKTKWKGAFPRPPAPHVSRIILYWKRKPISGSSFDWNMLSCLLWGRPPGPGIGVKISRFRPVAQAARLAESAVEPTFRRPRRLSALRAWPPAPPCAGNPGRRPTDLCCQPPQIARADRTAL